MDSHLFLYAKIPLASGNTNTQWLTLDNSLHYVNCDILDFSFSPAKYLSQVFDLYRHAYAQYIDKGVEPLITEKEQLLKYNRWVLFHHPDDPDVIVGFTLFRTTPCGLKSALGGRLSTVAGAGKMLLLFKIDAFHVAGIFGEISGALEKAIIKQVPVVPFITARKVLEVLGKRDVVVVGDDHYSRVIGHLGCMTKVMVGRPLLT